LSQVHVFCPLLPSCQVLALGSNGQLFYDTVILIPHHNNEDVAVYHHLHITSLDGSNRTAKLTLSAGHAALVPCDTSDTSDLCPKYAMDVVTGEKVWLAGSVTEPAYMGVINEVRFGRLQIWVTSAQR
jgi:acetyltransferase-like isoleucine patch superfamily enzyme